MKRAFIRLMCSTFGAAALLLLLSVPAMMGEVR